MNFTKYLLLYFISILVFIFVDAIWLKLNNSFYRNNIGHLMSNSVNITAVVIFYIIYTIGITSIAVAPGLSSEKILKTIISGAILGLVAYGTYDFTNWATLKEWPLKVVLADVAWGTFITSLVSTLSYVIGNLVK